jgi:hypothetical protein
MVKLSVFEELREKKDVLENQVSKLTHEVDFLNQYIGAELTNYTQGIAHLKEDIKMMRNQNSKVGSTVPGVPGSRINNSIQSWEDSSLPGSKQISVSTNAILLDKGLKPAEVELEAVRTTMEKMKQSFSKEKEQLLVENIKLKRKMHEMRQGSLKMRSLAGENTQIQKSNVPGANNQGISGLPPVSPRKDGCSINQRDSLGSIDLVPNGYLSNQVLLQNKNVAREPFLKQNTHGGEMNVKTTQVDKKIDVPHLDLELANLKKEDGLDVDSLYQSHRFSVELRHHGGSSDEDSAGISQRSPILNFD